MFHFRGLILLLAESCRVGACWMPHQYGILWHHIFDICVYILAQTWNACKRPLSSPCGQKRAAAPPPTVPYLDLENFINPVRNDKHARNKYWRICYDNQLVLITVSDSYRIYDICSLFPNLRPAFRLRRFQYPLVCAPTSVGWQRQRKVQE